MDPVSAIMSLHGRYCWLVDHRDWDRWQLCFAEDGAFVARGQRHEGRAAIVEYVKAELERFGVIRHLAHVPYVEVQSASSATARSYFELRAGTMRGADTLALGTYVDQLVCSEGEWRFAERVAEFDYWVRRGDPWFSQ
jgi:hypothetical protein